MPPIFDADDWAAMDAAAFAIGERADVFQERFDWWLKGLDQIGRPPATEWTGTRWQEVPA
jgi:hypothetical protein